MRYARARMSDAGFTAGTVLGGRYRVVRVLGRGGMGMVLEVVHVQLGGRHALKLLHGEHTRDAELVARFENEAKIAGTLRSDHLVRVTDMGRLPTGEPYLVMDYLHGADLDQLLELHQRFTVPVAVRWILEACVGLAHLHAAGLVHRDVKPSNLFLSEEPDGAQIVKVLDFGLAKMPALGGAQRLTSTAANFGTPQFMAPEQIMSAKHVDARCDQHALGLVLYELLVGEPAFVGETAGAITVAIATQPPPRPSHRHADLPPALDQVVVRALAKRPQDRYPTLVELAHALAPFGAAGSAELAAMVGSILGRSAVVEPPKVQRATVSAFTTTDDAPTQVRPPDITSGGLSSSTNPTSRGRWTWFALVAGLATALCGVGVVLLLVRSPAHFDPMTASEPTVQADVPADIPAPGGSHVTPSVVPTTSSPSSAVPWAERVSVSAGASASASSPVGSASAAKPSANQRPSPLRSSSAPVARPPVSGGQDVFDQYTPGKKRP